MPVAAIIPIAAAVVGGIASSKIAGAKTGAEKALTNIAQSGFLGKESQSFLPPELQAAQTGDILQSGVQGIGDLIKNPGGLSPNVSDAIRQRLAGESEGIAQDFRGIGQNQAGAAARGNTPGGIKDALSSALDIAQSRAQRGARRNALTDSDNLRRQDLNQTFQLEDAILQFMSSGKGLAIQGLAPAAELASKRQAAKAAGIGSAISALGKIGPGMMGGGGGGSPIPS